MADEFETTFRALKGLQRDALEATMKEVGTTDLKILSSLVSETAQNFLDAYSFMQKEEAARIADERTHLTTSLCQHLLTELNYEPHPIAVHVAIREFMMIVSVLGATAQDNIMISMMLQEAARNAENHAYILEFLQWKAKQ